ncbi:MAG: DUF3971 domain-containing protein, partial [Kangiellaceae bacterium]|nr:DUF3971 domain-containing protein [Kangiellaceae bacterium]
SSQKKSYQKLTLSNLTIKNYSQIHQIKATIRQGDVGFIDVRTELYGDPRLPDAKAYLRANIKDFEISSLPLFDQLLSDKVSNGQLNASVTAEWSENNWQAAQLVMNLNNFEFVINDREFGYNTLDAELFWLTDGYYSKFSVSKLEAETDQGNLIDLSGLNGVSSQLYKPQVYLEYNAIKPGSLNAVWSLLIDEPKLKKWFLDANPQVNVDKLSLALMKSNDDWEVTEANVDFSDLTIAATSDSPGVPPLTGTISIDDGVANFSFEATEQYIDLTPYINEPLKASLIKGSGEFINRKEFSQLSISNLELTSNSLNLIANSNVYFSADDATDVNVWLSLDGTDLAKLRQLLPESLVSADLYQYLTQSINAGEIRNSQLMFASSASKSEAHSLFKASLDIDNLNYAFAPGYPAADIKTASLVYDNDTLSVTTTTAEYLNTKVNQAVATITAISSSPVLDLDINITTDHDSAKAYINNSELKETLSDVLADIYVDGRYDVILQLNSQLATERPDQFLGKVLLADNKLVIKSAGLNFDKVNGTLLFNQQDLWANQVTSRFFGGQSVTDIITKTVGEERRISFFSSSSFDSTQVINWVLPGNQLDITGQAKATTDAWFCVDNCQGLKNSIKVASDLVGIVIEAPQPIKKSAKDVTPFNFALATDAVNQVIEFDYNEVLNSVFSYDVTTPTTELVFSKINLTELTEIIEFENNQTTINASLDRADMIDWVDFVQKIMPAIESTQR